MIIEKITTGFVVQKFDTKKGKWISQEFVCDDEVSYEYEDGNVIDDIDFEVMTNNSYLPFKMKQP